MEIISSQKELSNREKFQFLYAECPISINELMYNMGLFITRQNMMRIFFMNEIYQKILGVHGSIIEGGIRWGQNMALYTTFRGIYEPYNYNRKIIGFDTFNSFVDIDEKDGEHSLDEMELTPDYDKYLDKLLTCHEEFSPISQIQKYEIVKGDACETLPKYLLEHPETVIALIMLDYDVYKPTKVTLEAIKPHLTKGSIIILDEVNHVDWKGETLSLQESFGTTNIKLQHSKYSPNASYFIVE